MTSFEYQFNTKPFSGKTTFKTGLFIDGKFVDGSDSGTIEYECLIWDIIDLTVSSILNPTNGKVITKVSEGTRQDVDKAVAAAQKAYDTVWGLKVSQSSYRPGLPSTLTQVSDICA